MKGDLLRHRKNLFFEVLVVLLFLIAAISGTSWAETYQYVAQWGAIIPPNGTFHDPEKVAVDPSGNVYVADTLNSRIQKFDSNGNFITKWGSYGSGDGQFNYPGPKSVSIDALGNVYVVDEGNSRIQKFGSNGNFLAKWGSFGYGNRGWTPVVGQPE